MRKLRLLIIAPYEGLKGLCESIIGERNDVQADIYTASLEDSLKLIADIDTSIYDVIISRGTTGEMLQKAVDIPMIEIETTISDVIRATQLAQNHLTRFSFVGFSKLANQVKIYCESIQRNAEICSIDSVEDAVRTIKKLQSDGCLFIIGDGIAVDIAKSLGMGHILITSGAESVSAAIESAVKFHHMQEKLLIKNRLLETALAFSGKAVTVFDDSQNVVFARYSEQHSYALQEKLKAHIALLQRQSERQFYETIGRTSFRVSGKTFHIGNADYYTFCYSKAVKKAAAGKELYETEAFSDAKLNNYLSLYNPSEVMMTMLDNVKNCSNYSLPFLISGEPGCGKDTLAYTVYALSPARKSLFFTIDCARLSDKDWDFLLNSEDSPLYENNNSLYFRRISALSRPVQQELHDFIKHSSLFTRNQVIASISTSAEQHSEVVAANSFYRLFNEIPLNIPPLRERINELPGIAACYINEINQLLPTQVIGFEEEAMKLLMGFAWPVNIDQLKQVVKELVVITNTSYITAENTRLVLKQQQNRPPHSRESVCSIDLTQSLDTIEKEVISSVLRKNNMNQSAAAKQLGISRGTLWRKLKN